MANQLDLLKQVFKILKYYYYLFYRTKIFFPKKSYSLLGEDLFIDRYFNKKSKGFYIDVGCHHPLSGNNTYLLYKKGWRGINIDADKTSIKLFNKFRKKDHNLNYIVSDKEEIKEFYYYHARSAINTISKDLVDHNYDCHHKISST